MLNIKVYNDNIAEKTVFKLVVLFTIWTGSRENLSKLLKRNYITKSKCFLLHYLF